MKNYPMTRDEAEALVDLLEKHNPPFPLEAMAEQLREYFGMATRKQEEGCRRHPPTKD